MRYEFKLLYAMYALYLLCDKEAIKTQFFLSLLKSQKISI